MKTARLALRNFRQLELAYAANAPDIPAVQEAFSQASSLAASMNQPAAVAELVGSPSGRQHTKAIYDRARACADFFQIRELLLAALPNTAVGKAFSVHLPEGFGKAIPFDARKASALSDELATAIDQFIDAVNTELGALAARSGRTGSPPPLRAGSTGALTPPRSVRSASQRRPATAG